MTTLNLLRAQSPCADGWAKLLKHLGKTGPDDEPLTLTVILKSNGLDDALWALRAVVPEQAEDRDREERLLACDYAEAVLPIFEARFSGDARCRACILTARLFAVGRATQAELDAAWAAAWAARDARDAAGAAAWAARDAPGDAARVAAWVAAKNQQVNQFKARFCSP